MMRFLVAAAATLVAFVPAFASGQSGATYTPYVISGTTAPGTDGAGSFGPFGTPVINSSGTVAFSAGLSGASLSTSNDSGIWQGVADNFTLIAREGAPAPGQGAGVTFSDLKNSVPTQNSAGDVVFINTLSGATPSTSQSLWMTQSGALTLLARSGTPAPGTSFNFSGFAAPNPITSAGEAAFAGQLTSGSGGLWRGSPGSVNLIATNGTAAPGAGPGATFFSFGNAPVFNDANQVAFSARVDSPSIFDSLPQGIWIDSGGTLTSVVVRGQSAPGSGGGTFLNVSEPKINDAGSVAFRGLLTDGRFGIWVNEESGLTPALIVGQPAPGAPGRTINSVDFPTIGGNGNIVVFGRLDNIDSVIWTGPASSLTLVARTGQTAPGTGGGTFNAITGNVINSHGQIAFRSTLNATTSNAGLFAIDQFGELVKVVRTGDSLPIDEFTSRTVSDFSISAGSGGQDGRAVAFNDAGQLAFRASFTDGSDAVYVARVGGAARLSLNPPIYGPSAVQGHADLAITKVGPGQYVPAIADVSSNAGYVRFSGITHVNAPVFVYLKVLGGASAVDAVRRELASAESNYGYTVEAVDPPGPLSGFNLLVVFAGAASGGTQTFSWNMINIPGANLDALAIVPEPASATIVALSAAMLLRRRGR